MPLRFHEIAEANHHILNPFTHEKLMLLGDICRLRPGMTQLDLACGKGEMLCQWARAYGISGVGVDISTVFLEAARSRAEELEVADRIWFLQADAATYPQYDHAFDILSCIGATWIGKGLVGTLELMKRAVKNQDSLLLVGEPYWVEPPPEEAYMALQIREDEFTSLDGTLSRIESVDLELVEMVLADPDSWDRYAASQWMTLSNWLRANPHDRDANDIQQWLNDTRRAHLQYQRRYLGWGVFVVRVTG